MLACVKNKIVMVTGYSGSGKSEFSSMLRDEFDGTVVNVGDEMRVVAKNNGYGRLRDFFGAVGINESFSQSRPYILGAIHDKYSSGNVIVDGAYEQMLVELVIGRFGRRNSFVVNVLADSLKRIERISGRAGLEIDGAREASRRDAVKITAGINSVIEMSDFVVDNNGNTKNDLRLKSRQIAQCVLNER